MHVDGWYIANETGIQWKSDFLSTHHHPAQCTCEWWFTPAKVVQHWLRFQSSSLFYKLMPQLTQCRVALHESKRIGRFVSFIELSIFFLFLFDMNEQLQCTERQVQHNPNGKTYPRQSPHQNQAQLLNWTF